MNYEKNKTINLDGFKQRKVALSVSNKEFLSDVIWQCFKDGICIVPIDPKMDEGKRESIINYARCSAIINDKELILLEGGDKCSPDDRIIIFTSGSTGDPKGVVLTKQALCANAESLNRLHGFSSEGCSHITPLPLFHVNAMCMSVIACKLNGCNTHYIQNFVASEFFEAIRKSGARTASIVPALLHDVVRDCNSNDWPQCLDYLITAAAPLTSDLAERFYNKFGPKIVQGYGLSESVNFSFVMPLLNDKDFVKEYIENHPPVGLPLDDQDFYIAEDGEVLVSGGSLFKNYLYNRDATNDAIIKTNGVNYLKTGDTGFLRGKYLVLNGRKKEVINRGGENIYPSDIEESWRKEVSEDVLAFPVKSTRISEDIGVCASRDADIESILALKSYRPSAGLFTNGYRTSTGKPQRLKMGKGMMSYCEGQDAYDSLIQESVSVAKCLLESVTNVNILTDQCRSIYDSAKMCVEKFRSVSNNADPLSGPTDILKWIKNNASEIMDGKLKGSDYLRSRRNKGWEQLMIEPPMGTFPIYVSKFMEGKELLKGNVLELGSGVGNLSRLISPYCDNLIRTDLSVDFMQSFFKSGNEQRYDFDDYPPYRNIDTIVACNSLHCATDIQMSINNFHDVLNDDGYLVLGEGNSHDWCLDFVFCLFDGWWDKSKFLPRQTWLKYFNKAGFSEFGFTILRFGRHDIGSVLWAKK